MKLHKLLMKMQKKCMVFKIHKKFTKGIVNFFKYDIIVISQKMRKKFEK